MPAGFRGAPKGWRLCCDPTARIGLRLPTPTDRARRAGDLPVPSHLLNCYRCIVVVYLERWQQHQARRLPDMPGGKTATMNVQAIAFIVTCVALVMFATGTLPFTGERTPYQAHILPR